MSARAPGDNRETIGAERAARVRLLCDVGGVPARLRSRLLAAGSALAALAADSGAALAADSGAALAADSGAALAADSGAALAADSGAALAADSGAALAVDWAATQTVGRRKASAVGAGDRVLVPGDRWWPAALDALPDPPGLLFVRGEVPPGPRLAVVGAREPDDYGRAVTRALSAAAVGCGWTVVSGGARGVDGEAHRAALAAGGRTVVVLGSGLGKPYPREHRGLFGDVAARGAVLSEYPAWQGPRPRQFPERNRIVAALADAVLVTQCRRKSGALGTVRVARAIGRPVLAVPADICYRLGSGTGGLLASGAAAVCGPRHLVTVLRALARGERHAGWPRDAEPLGSRMGLPPGWPEPTAAAVDPETRRERAAAWAAAPWLRNALPDASPQLVDDVVARSGRPTADVLRALVQLELTGAVERLHGGFVRAVVGNADRAPPPT